MTWKILMGMIAFVLCAAILVFLCADHVCTEKEMEGFIAAARDLKCAKTPKEADRLRERLYQEYKNIYDLGTGKISKNSIVQIFGKSMANSKYPLTYILHVNGYAEGSVLMFYIDFYGNVSEMRTGLVIE